jgi:hypothetical protein
MSIGCLTIVFCAMVVAASLTAVIMGAAFHAGRSNWEDRQ